MIKASKLKSFYNNIKTKHFFYLQETSILQIMLNINSIFLHLKLISLDDTTNKQDNAKNRLITRFKISLQKLCVGALMAFIFWLPFWCFIMAEIMPFDIYMIFASLIFVVSVIYGFIFLRFNIFKLNIFRNTLKYRIRNLFNSFLSCYFVFICICIVIFSIWHNNIYIITSLFYPLSIAIFLFMPIKYRFQFGFFVGIFGFYWMTLSFRFQDLDIFIPFAIIGVGIIYGIFLWFILFFQNIIYRIIMLSLLFVLYPLEFNWFNVAYLSSYSVFSSSLISMFLISLSILIALLQNKVKYISLILILFAFDYNFTIQIPQLNANIVETNYSQSDKWQETNKHNIIIKNFNTIQDSINNYQMVILPETSFPFVLNREQIIFEKLLDLSNNIIIFAGSIRYQPHTTNEISIKHKDFIELDRINQTQAIQNYNSSTQEGYYNTIFVFVNGQVIAADKVSLVPFGEILPYDSIFLPILKSVFNESFGFNKGNYITTLKFHDIKIAIANCYEGTLDLPYKTGAKYIIMMSNNAWFYPSTQAFMQKMIVKYYARSYNAFVYHSTNHTKKAIITPNNGHDL